MRLVYKRDDRGHLVSIDNPVGVQSPCRPQDFLDYHREPPRPWSIDTASEATQLALALQDDLGSAVNVGPVMGIPAHGFLQLNDVAIPVRRGDGTRDNIKNVTRVVRAQGEDDG